MTAIPSSASCSGETSVGAPLIGSIPAWFFGKATVSRMYGSARSAHRAAIDARCDAAVRRRSHCQGIQQEAELLALFLGGDVEQAEDLRLQLGLVDSEGNARDLDPAHDQV